MANLARAPSRREGALDLPSRPAAVGTATLDRSGPTAPSTSGDPQAQRLDLLLVADMVEPGSRVLDVGCGDGALLALLRDRRNVDGRGIELSRDGVNQCLAEGLPVIQGDADTDLADYPNDAFDYVILSQTIQATRQPKVVLEHLLRIGRRAIVSFPNFGHWRVRVEVGLKGRMPMTDNPPNIHFCTIRDFVGLCREVGSHMERAVALDAAGQPIRFNLPWWAWNLFGEQAVFLLRRGD
jgi:methionine biosynthesis protein MetW